MISLWLMLSIQSSPFKATIILVKIIIFTSNFVLNICHFKTTCCFVFPAVYTTEGRLCFFPFTYRGDTYFGCTTARSNRPWCSYHAQYQGNWGDCDFRNGVIVPNGKIITLVQVDCIFRWIFCFDSELSWRQFGDPKYPVAIHNQQLHSQVEVPLWFRENIGLSKWLSR